MCFDGVCSVVPELVNVIGVLVDGVLVCGSWVSTS